jgi:hypothetical protein
MHRNDFENSRNTFRLGQSRHEASMSGSLSTGSDEFPPHLRHSLAAEADKKPLDHAMARTAQRIGRASKNTAQTSRRF